MDQPIVYIDPTDQKPTPQAMRAALSALFSIRFVDQAVDADGKEADLITTTKVDRALVFVKDTETAIIVLVYWNAEDKPASLALASRFSGRIEAVCGFRADEGKPALIPYIVHLLSRKKGGDS